MKHPNEEIQAADRLMVAVAVGVGLMFVAGVVAFIRASYHYSTEIVPAQEAYCNAHGMYRDYLGREPVCMTLDGQVFKIPAYMGK